MLAFMFFRNPRDMREGTRQSLQSMADTVDLRDPLTGGHSRRVEQLCAVILAELPVSPSEMDLVRMAARVHDIGKITLPEPILKKQGVLTAEEYALIKTHPEMGAELLSRFPDFRRGADYVRHHHEHWDGHGYPRGLREYSIPLGARVIAVADAFDAMTSDRSYRAAMTPSEAISVLRDMRGRQWDPHVVDAFLRALPSHSDSRSGVVAPAPAD